MRSGVPSRRVPRGSPRDPQRDSTDDDGRPWPSTKSTMCSALSCLASSPPGRGRSGGGGCDGPTATRRYLVARARNVRRPISGGRQVPRRTRTRLTIYHTARLTDQTAAAAAAADQIATLAPCSRAHQVSWWPRSDAVPRWQAPRCAGGAGWRFSGRGRWSSVWCSEWSDDYYSWGHQYASKGEGFVITICDSVTETSDSKGFHL